MRVIIVGGGFAGLTLAGALEKGGIDFVLLEARSLFDPQVGASIALNAASMRILDQIGAAQDIISQTAPVKVSKVHRSDGTLVMPPAITFQILKARFGYGACFLARQGALRALADSIASKDKLLLNKAVKNIEMTTSGVVAKCEDGSSYSGDIVVGCDGVNSKSSIRSEMWRLAGQTDPEYFPITERTKMKAEFNCLFGISDPVDGLSEGDVDTTFDKGRSMLVITGKHGRVFWFYHEKLDKVYQAGAKDFPRYTKADAEALAEKNSWRKVNETVTLGQLWEKRVSYALVPLEEALFHKWSWKRIATVGDNSHKMTPNHGQAGNNAIESAAALANQLKRICDDGRVTSEAIESALRKWQQKRQARVSATCHEAAAICRLQALDSRMAYFVMNYVVPNATQSLLTLVTSNLIGAEILEYLPVPAQSFEGSCPFNPNQGIGKSESLLKRTIMVAPLFLASYYVQSMTLMPGIEQRRSQNLQPGHTMLIDHRLQWLESFRFLVEACLIYAIWLIESSRRANILTLAQIPSVFCILACKFGPGVVSPCYYALHFIFSSIEKFAAADARLTNVIYTRTILPLLLLLISIPALLALTGHTDAFDQLWWQWPQVQLLPVFIAIMQLVMAKAQASKTSMDEDAINNPKRDIPYIRSCWCTLATISAVTWISVLVMQPTSPIDSFRFALLPNPHGSLLDLNRHGVLFSSLVWIGLLILDIKSAGMVKESWLKILTVGFISSVLAGPAVTVALGWIWREHTLATKREKHALTMDKYADKSVIDVQGRNSSATRLGKENWPNGKLVQ